MPINHSCPALNKCKHATLTQKWIDKLNILISDITESVSWSVALCIIFSLSCLSLCLRLMAVVPRHFCSQYANFCQERVAFVRLHSQCWLHMMWLIILVQNSNSMHNAMVHNVIAPTVKVLMCHVCVVNRHVLSTDIALVSFLYPPAVILSLCGSLLCVPPATAITLTV